MSTETGRNPSGRKLCEAWRRMPKAIAVFFFATAAGFVYMFGMAAPDWYVGMAPTPPSAFVPSAMFAFGRGLVRSQEMASPAMQAFFTQQTPRLAASDVPADLRTWEDPWDLRHGYLLTSIGYLWRLTGPSWPAVKALLAIAFGISFLLAYALCRISMRHLVAFLVTGAALLSFEALRDFSSVRDGLKVPFFYGVFVLLAVLIIYRPRARYFLGAAALLGGIIGIGLGFRHDIYICLFPAVATVLLCPRPRQEGRALLVRAAAVAILLTVYLACSAPVRSAIATHGLPGHDMVMGLATDAWDHLGLTRASYEFVYVNNDSVVSAMAEGYLQRNTEMTQTWMPGSNGEELGQWPIIFATIALAPFDWLLRQVAALLWVIAGTPQDPAIPGLPIEGWLDVWLALMLVAAATAFVLAARKGLWQAWLVLALCVYFCSYITLQFQYRHGFHLALAAPWILGFLAEAWLRAAGSLRPSALARALRQSLPLHAWWSPANRPAILSLGVALCLGGCVLAGARVVQAHQFDGLLEQYDKVPLSELTFEPCATTDWVLLRPKNLKLPDSMDPAEQWSMREDYLVVQLEGALEMRPMWLIYEHTGPGARPSAYSYCLFIPATSLEPGGRLRAFIPIYHPSSSIDETFAAATAKDIAFMGLAMKPSDAGAVFGLSVVSDASDFALMPLMWIPEDRSLFREHRSLGQRRTWRFGGDLPISSAACAGVDDGS